MEHMDGLGCGWEEGSDNVEEKATVFWYWNPIAAVHYILGHRPFKEHLSYASIRQMDASGEHIYAKMWTADWWWKTQAS
jgi:hypothetical protein